VEWFVLRRQMSTWPVFTYQASMLISRSCQMIKRNTSASARLVRLNQTTTGNYTDRSTFEFISSDYWHTQIRVEIQLGFLLDRNCFFLSEGKLLSSSVIATEWYNVWILLLLVVTCLPLSSSLNQQLVMAPSIWFDISYIPSWHDVHCWILCDKFTTAIVNHVDITIGRLTASSCIHNSTGYDVFWSVFRKPTNIPIIH